MTQQKAASLTSSLFARKGKASPASLLISELQQDEAETVRPTIIVGVDSGKAAFGKGTKIPVSQLSGATARKKTAAPEIELPLLAFVEAQIAANPVGGEAEETDATVAADGSAPSARGLSPAASLLDRGLQPASAKNGKIEVPAAEPEESSPIEAEIVVESDAGKAIESETVSGDANVAAIVDAPEDEGAPEEVAQSHDSPAAKADAVIVESQADDGPATRSEDDTEDAAEAATIEPVIVPPVNLAETGDAEITESEKPDEEPSLPASEAKGAAEATMSATLALRNAAALNTVRGLPDVEVAPPPVPTNAPKGSLPWQSAAVIALGAILGLVGYLVFSGEPAEDPAEPATSTVEATPPEMTTGSVAESSPESKAAVPAPEQAEAAPMQAAPAAEAPAPEPEPEPSFDVIRIESNGQSIIAGRAEPLSEWILLNNGQPIASIQADAYGEWVVLPDASLVPGANAFSLVPKTERGKVAIPAPSAPKEAEPAPELEAPLSPRSDAGSDGLDVIGALEEQAEVTLPKPRPNLRGAVLSPLPQQTFRVVSDGVYEVQVASVRQSADAERELGRLAAAFPASLGELDLRVQEASVEGAGTFFRVRSGAVEDLGVAREICRLLEARNQGCLVVRRAPTPIAAPREATQDAAPTRSPVRQQAERPQ